jgi:hypothetical protein
MQLIANALGLLLCRGQNQTMSTLTLFRVGFTKTQIAGLVGTTRDTVNTAIYDATHDKKKKGGKKKTRGED